MAYMTWCTSRYGACFFCSSSINSIVHVLMVQLLYCSIAISWLWGVFHRINQVQYYSTRCTLLGPSSFVLQLAPSAMKLTDIKFWRPSYLLLFIHLCHRLTDWLTLNTYVHPISFHIFICVFIYLFIYLSYLFCCNISQLHLDAYTPYSTALLL